MKPVVIKKRKGFVSDKEAKFPKKETFGPWGSS